MKKLIMTLCLGFGLAFAFGSDEEKKDEIKERVVLLSKLDWADVQRGMEASNSYHFVEEQVTLVITNKSKNIPGIVVVPYRPVGRGPDKVEDIHRRIPSIEPPDYVK